MTGTADLQAWIDVGLFDPEAEGAASLAEVLRFYDSVGIDPADFAHVDPDEIVSAVNMSVHRPGPRLRAVDVIARSGLSEVAFRRMAAAVGYDPEGEFTELDAEAFAAFGVGAEMFSEDALIDFGRVLAAAMARVADATTALFRVDAAPRIEASGGAEVDYARENHRSAQLIEPLSVAMRAFFLNQLAGAITLSDHGRLAASGESTTTIRIAVGFVDIVGYTHLSTTVAPDELARFIIDFEALASAVVAEHGGRLVKLIGDEIMFVGATANQAVAIADAIVATFEDTDAVPRGGVVAGEVIGVGGDYYGEVVNLASRIADQAVPGEVLVDSQTAAAADEHDFELAGRRQLKGFAEPVALAALER